MTLNFSMLPRSLRLRGENKIREVRGNGRNRSGPLLGIRFRVREDNNDAQWAIVTSARAFPKAVLRSRVRRRCRAAIIKAARRAEGFDAVLIPKKGSDRVKFSEIVSELENHVSTISHHSHDPKGISRYRVT